MANALLRSAHAILGIARANAADLAGPSPREPAGANRPVAGDYTELNWTVATKQVRERTPHSHRSAVVTVTARSVNQRVRAAVAEVLSLILQGRPPSQSAVVPHECARARRACPSEREFPTKGRDRHAES
jgi:hypothetical protein